MQFAVRRALRAEGNSRVGEDAGLRLAAMVADDCARMSARLLAFRRSQSAQDAGAVRDLAGAMLQRYSQFPFATAPPAPPRPRRPVQPPAPPPAASTPSPRPPGPPAPQPPPGSPPPKEQASPAAPFQQPPSPPSSSSGRASPGEAAFAEQIASADDLVLTADAGDAADLVPMLPTRDALGAASPSPCGAQVLQMLSVSDDHGEAAESARTGDGATSLQGFRQVETRWSQRQRAARPASSGTSMRPMSVNTTGPEASPTDLGATQPLPVAQPVPGAAAAAAEPHEGDLDCLGQDADGVLVAAASDAGEDSPCMTPPGAVLRYDYPLNAMLYATLLRTFFAAAGESPTEAAAAAAAKHGGAGGGGGGGAAGAKRRQSVGVLRSRRQESRMKEVVDVLAPLRATFEVSSFLHASCFVHVVFTESLEGCLGLAEVFKLLSVDCYFYPGFGAFCATKGLAPDEEACRRQVLLNMRDEYLPKLADYHKEFAADPEDLIFCVKLHATVLEAFHGSYASPAPPPWAPPDDAPAAHHRRERSSTAAGEREVSAGVMAATQPPVSRQLRFAEDVPSHSGRSSTSSLKAAGGRPASAPQVRGCGSGSRSGTPVREGSEAEWCSARDGDAAGLQSALMAVAALFGADIAGCVREAMMSGGVREAADCSMALYSYAELLALTISSCYKHFIRIKGKVVAQRGGGRCPTGGAGGCDGDCAGENGGQCQLSPFTRGWDLILGQLQPLHRSAAPASQSCTSPLSMRAAAGDAARMGAERLVPRTGGRWQAPQRPVPPGQQQSLSQANAQLRLDVNQTWQLCEVLLFELHADTRYYCPSLISVIPSAAAIVLNLYSQLLASDVAASLDALTIIPAPPPESPHQGREDRQVTPPGPTHQAQGPARDTSPDGQVFAVSLSEAQVRVGSSTSYPNSPEQLMSSAPTQSECTPPHLPTPPTDTRPAPEPSAQLGPAALGEADPLVPRRSQSPVLPPQRAPAPLPFADPMREVRADDTVSLSILNANLVYCTLLIVVLKENLRGYVSLARSGRSELSVFLRQADSGGGPRDSAYWLAGVPTLQQQPPAGEPDSGRWSCISADSEQRKPQRSGSLRLLRWRSGAGPSLASTAPPHTRAQRERAQTLGASGGSVGAAGDAPDFGPNTVWEQQQESLQQESSSAGAAPRGVRDTIDAALGALVERVSRRWREVVDASVDDYVPRALAADCWEPVGTLRDEVISSSAVDIAHMANRISVLVEHGIENAWDTMKAAKSTVQLHPLSPESASERSLCERFTSVCESCVSQFEAQCKQLLSTAYLKYCTAITAPLARLRLDRSPDAPAPIDPRMLRHQHQQLFDTADSSLPRMALRANNLLFCRSRFEEVYQRVVSRLALVAWRRQQPESPQPPQAPAPVGAPPAAVRREGKPMALSRALLDQQCAASPAHSPPHGPQRLTSPVFSSETLAAAEDAVQQVLMFMATKVVVFDAAEPLRLLYTTTDHCVDSVLEPLGGSLEQATARLLPSHRKPFLCYAVGTLSHAIATKLVRGKMLRPSIGRFAFFQQLVEDLLALREFFLARDGDGVPRILSEGEVESMTACVLSAILLLLSKNPTDIILQQTAGDSLPHHLTYTKAQIHGMVEQIAGRSPVVHEFLLEALEVQRCNELQQAWDEQRQSMLAEPLAPGSDRGASPRTQPAGGAQKAPDKDEKKKPAKSRLCTIQ